jgi:hypothetical protein
VTETCLVSKKKKKKKKKKKRRRKKKGLDWCWNPHSHRPKLESRELRYY